VRKVTIILEELRQVIAEPTNSQSSHSYFRSPNVELPSVTVTNRADKFEP